LTLVTVSSVKGAPGGTTVALLLSRSLAGATVDSRTTLLLECDPAGGDLAPTLGLPGVPGLASLALAGRHGLTVDLLLAHAQAHPSRPELRLLLGVAGPEQGAALRWIWRDLACLLSAPSLLVVADLGRCGVDDRHGELCETAAANLLITTDDVASLLHAKAAVEASQRAGRAVGVIVTGERRRRLSQVSQAMNAEVLGAVRYDRPAVSSLLARGDAARFRVGEARARARSDALLADVERIACRLATRVGIEASAAPAMCTGSRVSTSRLGQSPVARFLRKPVIL